MGFLTDHLLINLPRNQHSAFTPSCPFPQGNTAPTLHTWAAAPTGINIDTYSTLDTLPQVPTFQINLIIKDINRRVTSPTRKRASHSERQTATAKPILNRVRNPASTEHLFQRADRETTPHRGGQEQPTPNSTRIGAGKRLEDPEGHAHATTQVP